MTLPAFMRLRSVSLARLFRDGRREAELPLRDGGRVAEVLGHDRVVLIEPMAPTEVYRRLFFELVADDGAVLMPSRRYLGDVRLGRELFALFVSGEA